MAGIAIVALILIVLIETMVILNLRDYISKLHKRQRDLEMVLYDKVMMRE